MDEENKRSLCPIYLSIRKDEAEAFLESYSCTQPACIWYPLVELPSYFLEIYDAAISIW